MKRILGFILFLLLFSASNNFLSAEQKPAKIAISVWIGWMPFWVMQSEGFIAKRCKEQGVPTVEFAVMDYTASLSAYQAGAVDGVVATIMDSIRPVANGIDTTVVLINDFSNGGDGVLFKDGLKVEDTKTSKINIQLEQFSVSHYLFLRYLDSLGGKYKESDFNIQNISADNAGKAFLTDESVKAVVTWNPHLFQALENQKGKLMFSSKDIPGEIIDLLIFNTKFVNKNQKSVQAVVNAWYDVMKMLKDPARRKDALNKMASEAGATVKEFERMLEDVVLFDSPKKAAKFLESEKIKATEKKVMNFLIKQAQIDEEGQLTFDSSYIKNFKR
ncbi:ABC transporter substrate-binding protein [Candidatus Riflebacteria bacterium]